jgi:nucleoside-diphosphate-sugar epimerase
MRVFLAGATGVIGRSLVGMLLAAGHEVTGMTRSPQRAERLRAQGAEAVVCDALERESVHQAVLSARPEVVIHQLTDHPPRPDPRKYKTQLAGTNRLRREGTGNLVAAATAVRARRIIAQSIAFAYAPRGDWIKDEQAPLALDSRPPMDAIVAVVAELERQVLAVNGIVLRYGFFYGPGTQFAPEGYYAELARKRRFPVLGSGDGRWSFIHVHDAATATVAALEQDAPGVYNIVDDDPAPAREWIPAYAAAMGAKRPLRLPALIGRVAAGSAALAGMTIQRAATNAKAKRELDWAPQYASWRDGFQSAAG